MSSANDSVTITPGAGATIATHLVGGKEHQAVVLVDAVGQIKDDCEGVYVTTALAMAKAGSKTYLSIFNADPAIIVDVVGVWVSQEVTAAVTGLVRGYRLFRATSVHSAGTLSTPIALDTVSAALDADITIRRDGVTVSAVGEALSSVSIYEEETGGYTGRAWLWSQSETGLTIPLRQNQGVFVQQDSTAGTGVVSAGMIFRVRA